MKTITYVTSNNGKFLEVQQYLKRHAPEIDLVQEAVEIEEIQSMDLKVVATDKAKKAWQVLKAPLLIDDAGVFFNRWNQFPGVFTKFVCQGLGMEGIRRLIEPGDTGYFKLFLIYADEQGGLHSFEGRCDGQLTPDYQGTSHVDLPFDVCFKPEGLTLTYAEIKQDKAHEDYFYRLRAVKSFLIWYRLQS